MHGLTVDANPAVTADPAIAAPVPSYAAGGGPDQPAAGARKALVLLLAINLFNYIDRQILAAVEEPISKEFGVSQGKMGTLMTAFLLTYMVVSPVFGWLADRVSRWLLIGVGVIVWSLASGGSGLATTFGALFAMRCLIGVGEGAYGPVAPTVISDLYPVAVRGKVLSWFYVAIPVGSALGYVFGGMFAAPGKWHWAFLLTIPPGILLGVLCFFMRERRGGATPAAEAAGAVVAADVPARRASAADYRSLLRNRSYVLNCLAMTALTFALGGIAFFMPRYLSTAKGVPLGQANFWFGTVTAAAGLVATLAGGMAGDALRRRFGGAYFLVSAAGMLAGFPLFLAMLYATSPWAIWTLIFLAVFCLFFNTGPSNTALANVTHPSVRATAFAANIFVIHALGDAISPFVIGTVADHSDLRTGFLVVSASILVGGVLWLWAARYLEADTAAAPHGLDEPRGFPVTTNA